MYGRVSFLRDTKRIGDVSEVRVLAALVEAGFDVLIPFGENHRYDFVIDSEDGFLRVQVKTGRLREGAIRFNCYSSHAHRNGTSCRPYTGQIDYFGVFCPDNHETYLVPVDHVGIQGFLRVDAPRNGQRRMIRWAEMYRLQGRGWTKVVGPNGVRGVSLPGLLPS